MTPPLPKAPASNGAGDKFYRVKQMTEYGKACAAAEQARILKVCFEQARIHGTAGTAMYDAVQIAVRNHIADGGKLVENSPDCNPHPDAPHGFDRNASHGAGRYACVCEGWTPDWSAA